MKIRYTRFPNQVAIEFTSQEEVEASQDFLNHVSRGQRLDWHGARTITCPDGQRKKNSRLNIGGHLEPRIHGEGTHCVIRTWELVGGHTIWITPSDDVGSIKMSWRIRNSLWLAVRRVYFVRTVKDGDKTKGFIFRYKNNKPTYILDGKLDHILAVMAKHAPLL